MISAREAVQRLANGPKGVLALGDVVSTVSRAAVVRSLVRQSPDNYALEPSPDREIRGKRPRGENSSSPVCLIRCPESGRPVGPENRMTEK